MGRAQVLTQPSLAGSSCHQQIYNSLWLLRASCGTGSWHPHTLLVQLATAVQRLRQHVQKGQKELRDGTRRVRPTPVPLLLMLALVLLQLC